MVNENDRDDTLDSMLTQIGPDTLNEDAAIVPRLTSLGFEAAAILARLEAIKARRFENPFTGEIEKTDA